MINVKYPLGEFERDDIRSKTGRKLDEITLDEVRRGNITSEDIKVSKETLRKQAEVARNADNIEMAKNLERAAEMVDIPDHIILEMYNKLRPNRSTKAELLNMAEELRSKYQAENCAKLVLEAAEIYEKRGILL